MREASKPIAWYANILVSLPVESGREENQHMFNVFQSFQYWKFGHQQLSQLTIKNQR
jgi:hypothetical protein